MKRRYNDPMSNTDRFTQAVDIGRAERELTLQDLQALTGLHYVTISRLLARKQKSVTLEDAVKLARATGVSIDETCGLVETVS